MSGGKPCRQVSGPYRICFSAEATGQFFAFELLMGFAFVADVAITFYTPIIDPETGTWIHDRGARVTRPPTDLLSRHPFPQIQPFGAA